MGRILAIGGGGFSMREDGATAYQIQCDDGKFVEHALPVTQIGSPQPPRPPRQPVPVDRGILQAYVGRYRLMSPMIMTITLENDRLFTQLTGQDKFEIFPESSRDFFLKVVDAQLSFQTNDVGQATSLLLHQHGHDTTALKMAEDHQN